MTTSHSEVRQALSALLERIEPVSTGLADSLALSMHPWLDKPVSEDILEAMASELLPVRSLPHVDRREVAADRLMRLIELFRHEGESTSVKEYEEAICKLQEHIHTVELTREMGPSAEAVVNAVYDPLRVGSRRPPSQFYVGGGSRHNASDERSDQALRKVRRTVDATLICMARSGSADMGLMHACRATGVSAYDLLRGLNASLPGTEFDKFIESLDDRSRDITLSRIFGGDGAATLEELGRRWGVSRQRIGQIEAKIEARIAASLAHALSRLGRVIDEALRDVVRTSRLENAVLALAADTRWQRELAEAVLGTSGPWEEVGAWSIKADLIERVEEIKNDLVASADSHGLFASDRLHSALSELLDHEEDREEFARDALGLVHVRQVWSISRTKQGRILAALRHLGRPARKEEIIQFVETDPRHLGATLGAIPGVVRADLERWGFSEWVEDEYEGVFTEIEQRIDEHDGSVSADWLYEDILQRFGVSRASIDFHLSSDAFVVEDGMVSRNDGPFDAGNPASVDGAVKIDDMWGQRVLLSERHFKGYSLKISRDIAYANGVLPDSSLLVPVAGHAGEVSVIWRRSDPTRRIDVGRVSSTLEASGHRPDDTVIVVPTPTMVRILSDVTMPAAPSGELGSPVRSEDPTDLVDDPLLRILEAE